MTIFRFLLIVLLATTSIHCGSNSDSKTASENSSNSASDSPALDDIATPDEIEKELYQNNDLSLHDNLNSNSLNLLSKLKTLMTSPLTSGEVPKNLNGHQFKDSEKIVAVVNKAASGSTAQTVTIYVDGQKTYFWKVSTGREKYETAASGRKYVTATPRGFYRPTVIKDKHYSNTWHAWIEFPIFFVGGVAMHATTPDHYGQLGTRASGGCVRLHRDNAKIIHDLVVESGRSNVQRITKYGEKLTNPDGSPDLEYNYQFLIIVEDVQD